VREVGRAVYERIADVYGEETRDKLHKAHLERPATLALLGDVAGLRVLDAGCGPGWYAGELRRQGADVVGFDAVAAFTAQTRHAGAPTVVASLAEELPFRSGSFDRVVCALAIHYVRDPGATFAEFARVLRPGGVLVVSTHHPANDYRNHPEGSYFEPRLIEEQWRIGPVRFYRRSLTDLVDSLADAGFALERIVEPRPTPEAWARWPEACARLEREPPFLCLRGRVSGNQSPR
jgi:SAM-dependent methyltransferase